MQLARIHESLYILCWRRWLCIFDKLQILFVLFIVHFLIFSLFSIPLQMDSKEVSIFSKSLILLSRFQWEFTAERTLKTSRFFICVWFAGKKCILTKDWCSKHQLWNSLCLALFKQSTGMTLWTRKSTERRVCSWLI